MNSEPLIKVGQVVKVVIADDEALARDRLKRLLSAIPDVAVVAEASNGLEALTAVAKTQADVILLDIEMPVLNGLEVASVLVDQPVSIIFVTAYSEHALQAFEFCAFDYLVKPIVPERLTQSLSKWQQRRHTATSDFAQLKQALAAHKDPTLPDQPTSIARLAIRSGSRYVVVDITRISAILARDHYASILVEGRELLSEEPLEKLLQRLDSLQFMRVHRGALINLAFLKELVREGDRKYTAVLSDMQCTRVPVSRERLGALKTKLGLAD